MNSGLHLIQPDHPDYQYVGRMDRSCPSKVMMAYPGTYIRTRFTGTALAVRMSKTEIGKNLFLLCIVDGKESSILLEAGTEERDYAVAEGLEDTVHELILVRRNDFVSGHCYFHGVMLEEGKGLKQPDPRPARRIECYGDSLTAGGMSEAYGYEGKEDPAEHNGFYGQYCNGWYSYANILARLLDAEVHNNGIGGLALLDGYGYTMTPNMIGFESTYDKLNPFHDLGEVTPWDMSLYRPHVILLAIGQNDSSTCPDPTENLEFKTRWKNTYKRILHQIRLAQPQAVMILTTTVMNHPACWDDLLIEIADELEDPLLMAYRYKRAGCGTPGHLRKSEAEEMAREMAEYIGTLDDPWRERSIK